MRIRQVAGRRREPAEHRMWTEPDPPPTNQAGGGGAAAANWAPWLFGVGVRDR